MSPRNLLWLAMLAGCNPGGDGVGKDSGDPDTDAVDTPADDTDTPVDDTVDTVDTPDPGMTVEGPISVTTTGIVTCADPGRRGASYWDIRRAASQPVTEAVGDHSLKGGALVVAMMCDLLVTADNGKFSYPEAKLGFTGGLISALPTRIPHKIAMELIMLCRTIDAKRAYDVGFANEVVPVGQQVEAALAMARELATFAPLVLRTLKRFVVDDVMPQGPSEKMGRAMRDLGMVRDSQDGQEGARAFKEKRAPKWVGR